MKKCPFCGEKIQDEAIKCRYCKEFLNNPSKKPDSLDKTQQKDEILVKNNAVCPKCGFKRIEGDEECPRCGVIYAKAKKVSSRNKTPESTIEDVNKKPAGQKTVSEPEYIRSGAMSIIYKIFKWFCIIVLGMIGLSGLFSGEKFGFYIGIPFTALAVLIYFKAKGYQKNQRSLLGLHPSESLFSLIRKFFPSNQPAPEVNPERVVTSNPSKKNIGSKVVIAAVMCFFLYVFIQMIAPTKVKIIGNTAHHESVFSTLDTVESAANRLCGIVYNIATENKNIHKIKITVYMDKTNISDQYGKTPDSNKFMGSVTIDNPEFYRQFSGNPYHINGPIRIWFRSEVSKFSYTYLLRK